jgi:hypothetical protein
MDETVTRVSQSCDTPLAFDSAGCLEWRYLYMRAVESRELGQPGQDYLVFGRTSGTFVFALCDGVGQSYFGDLASRFLGDALVVWLYCLAPALDVSDLRDMLDAYLHDLTAPATRLIEAHRPPEPTSGVIEDVLREKRLNGSETTFACGRLDLPNAAAPRGRLLLAWMGDSRLRVWAACDVEAVEQPGPNTFVTLQRWSTRHGPVGGGPNVLVSPLVSHAGQLRFTRVLAYSDGASWLDAVPDAPTNTELSEQVRRSGELPTSDDVSLFELSVLPGVASDDASVSGS